MPLIVEDTRKQQEWEKQIKAILVEKTELEFPEESSGVFGKHREETFSHLTYEGIRRIFPSPEKHLEDDLPAHVVVEVEQRLAKAPRVHPSRDVSFSLLTYWFICVSKREVKCLRAQHYFGIEDDFSDDRLYLENSRGREFPKDTSVSNVEIGDNDSPEEVFFELSIRRAMKI